jgi:hypothetical protein
MVPGTGLIGALIIANSQISDIKGQIQNSLIFMREKPALLFPIGWRIFPEMGWNRVSGKRACFPNINFKDLGSRKPSDALQNDRVGGLGLLRGNHLLKRICRIRSEI